MALLTKCKFYFGVVIEEDNNVFDFDEGDGEISVTIPVGNYSPQEIADKLASLLTSNGTQDYSVTFDRTTRLLTIEAADPFDILIASGTHTATTLYDALGFTGAVDLTGADNYTGDTEVGIEYKPQFRLLDYIPLEHNVRSVQASINETGSGAVEVIKYGTKRFTEFSIEFINNYNYQSTDIWESSSTAVEDSLTFLSFATQKSKIEFMPDEADVETYSTLLLESTEADSKGIGFKLLEMLDYGAGYFKTGKLVFREVS